MAKPSREYIHGINPAFEVLRAGKRRIYQAYLAGNLAGNPRLRKLAAYLETKDVPIETVERQRLFELTKSKEHQGIALKCSPYVYARSDDLLGQPRLLLLDNVEDPHNVGAILRSAEVFGFHHVFLPIRGVPEVYPSVVKVSAGAAEHIAVAKDANANNYVRRAMEAGYAVAALDAKGAVDLRQLAAELPERLLLVVGGEAKAVGQFILNTADYIVRIEQHGQVNSLNASVAAGIAMYALSPSS